MNIIKDLSFQFALNTLRITKELRITNKEYVISNQLMRSATAIGAIYREAEYAESKADFIHKMSIAQKECNETLYWIDLITASNDFNNLELKSYRSQALSLMKLISKILVTSKSKVKGQ